MDGNCPKEILLCQAIHPLAAILPTAIPERETSWSVCGSKPLTASKIFNIFDTTATVWEPALAEADATALLWSLSEWIGWWFSCWL
jgi:hypothetical protein